MRQELEATPGPWATDYRKVAGGYAQEVFDSNGKTIATCAWYPVQVSDTTTATNRAANGRLIACAPEMLDVLLQWQNSDKDYDAAERLNARKVRDAVIAKALGMAANTK